MGVSFSRLMHAIGEKMGLFPELLEKARRDKMWRENPEIRKLVPKSRCPHCHCKLEGGKGFDLDSSDVESKCSDSEPEICSWNKKVPVFKKFPALMPMPVPLSSSNFLDKDKILIQENKKAVRFEPKISDEIGEGTPLQMRPQSSSIIKVNVEAEGVIGEKVNELNSNAESEEGILIEQEKKIEKSLNKESELESLDQLMNS